MKQLLSFWQTIRYSLWLIPAIVVGLAIVLAVAVIEIDSSVSADWIARWPRIFGSGVEGARSLLEVIASAMITIATLTFSVTILVLSLAASQYTPRVIRTFMSSRATQTVLGVFVGIFTYCLVVLRSVHGAAEEDAFVPYLAVIVAILLALIGVGLLVFFIHHIATSIQASSIVSSVAGDTIRMIDQVYPDTLVRHPEQDCSNEAEEPQSGRWHPVASGETGYLQTVDLSMLVTLADQHGVVVKMARPIGAFTVEGLPLAFVSAPVKAELARELNRAYVISHYRNVEQDIGVGIRQLVDIVLKAMSPAMNDTTTAILCIDYLSSVLIRLAPRCIVPDAGVKNGALRLLTLGASFEEFLREAFTQIREHAAGNARIYSGLLQALATLAQVVTDPDRKALIAREIQATVEYAKRNLTMADQRQRLEKNHYQAFDALR